MGLFDDIFPEEERRGLFDDIPSLLEEEEAPEVEAEPPARISDLFLSSPPVSFTRGLLGLGEATLSGLQIPFSAVKGISRGPSSMEAIPQALSGAQEFLGSAREALSPTPAHPLSSPRAFFSAFFESAPSLVAMAGAASLGGLPAAFAAGSTLEAGNTFLTLKSQDVEEGRAAASAAAAGTVSGMIELIPLSRLRRLFKGAGARTVREWFLSSAVQSGIEGGEEVAQEYVQWQAELLNSPDPEKFLQENPFRPRATASVAIGGLMGFVSGAGAGAITLSKQELQETAERKSSLKVNLLSKEEKRTGLRDYIYEISDAKSPNLGKAIVFISEEGGVASIDIERILPRKETKGRFFLSSPEDLPGIKPEEVLIPPALDVSFPVGMSRVKEALREISSLHPEIEVFQASFAKTGQSAVFKPPRPLDARTRDGGVAFSRPQVEAAVQRMRGGPPRTLDQDLKELTEGFKSRLVGFSREYKEIPHGSFHSPFREAMRQMRIAPSVGETESLDAMRESGLDKLSSIEYDLFIKKRFLDDMKSIRESYPADTLLPGNITDEDLALDGPRIDLEVELSPKVKKAVESQTRIWNEARSELAEAREAVGLDSDWLYHRGDAYLHHRVFEHPIEEGLGGLRGTKLPRGRSFEKKLKGSSQDIDLRYALVQGKVLGEIKADAMTARALKRIKDQYDIRPQLLEEAALEERTQFEIPEGYSPYHPSDERIFFSGYRLKDRLALEVIDQNVAEVTKGDIKKATMYGGRGEVWILPNEVVDVLERHGERVRDALGWKANEALQNTWKKAALFLPRRVVKYLTRNAVSDWNVVFQARPEIALDVPKIKRNAKELSTYFRHGQMSKELRTWIHQGGADSGLFSQEIEEPAGRRIERFVRSKDFDVAFELLSSSPERAISTYWSKVRGGTRFLESVMRYTAYRSFLEEIQKNGRPKDYAASIPEEIESLSSPEEKAYWLSNELVGAYDMVSQYGQFLRKEVSPFWSFQELNFRTQFRLMRNALTDERVAKAYATRILGAKAVQKAGSLALGAGKFLALASAFEVFLSVYNHLFFPDEERDLPEDVRNRAHIVLGRSPNGEVRYFDRLSRFQEFREWFGTAEVGYLVRDYLDGRMSPQDVAEEMTNSVVDKTVNSIGPIGIKGALELVTGVTTFPSATKPRRIEDRWEQFFRFWGLEKEYQILQGDPISTGGDSIPEKLWKSLPSSLYYTSEPGRTSLLESWRIRREFEKSRGEEFGAEFWSNKSVALRHFKRAVQFHQPETAQNKLLEYALAGGSPQGMRQSLRAMDPIAGMDEEELQEFLNYLRPEEVDVLAAARLYWASVLLPLDESEKLDKSDLVAIFEQGQEGRIAQGLSPQELKFEEIDKLRVQGFVEDALIRNPNATLSQLWSSARAKGLTGVSFRDFSKFVKDAREPALILETQGE